MIPAVLSIAGSDSSGGAGIQADIKTITAQRLYAETVITALTAQNTLGVTAVQNATPEFVLQQIDTVFDDIRPDAVKIGMVSSAEIAHAIASGLTRVKASNIVLDPVMVATSGAALLADDAVQVLIDELLPLADIVTPNIPEAQVLSGIEITSAADMLVAAQAIQRKMNQGKWVLVKGGHLDDGANDLLLTEHGREVWLGVRFHPLSRVDWHRALICKRQYPRRSSIFRVLWRTIPIWARALVHLIICGNIAKGNLLIAEQKPSDGQLVSKD